MEQDGIVTRGPAVAGLNDDTVARVQLKWDPSDTLSLKFGAMYSDSYSDGSPTDMTFFNMAPVCPSDRRTRTTAWRAITRIGCRTSSRNSGQERLRQDDARLTADDYAMPDWCFLDDQNPDWDDLCKQWNTSKYTQVDANDRMAALGQLVDSLDDGRLAVSRAVASVTGIDGHGVPPVRRRFRRHSTRSSSSTSRSASASTLVTGLSYFNEESGTPREALVNAVGSKRLQRGDGRCGERQ
jgi:hypothetical protein